MSVDIRRTMPEQAMPVGDQRQHTKLGMTALVVGKKSVKKSKKPRGPMAMRWHQARLGVT